MNIQWESNNKVFLDCYIKKTSSHWGKISYGLAGVIDGKEKSIKYTDEIDLINYDLYIKLPLHRIQSIFCSMILARPLKTIIKTCYHICFPISIPKEIYGSILKEKALVAKGLSKNPDYLWVATLAGAKSIADIIRTPVYGIALTLIAVAGTAISFFKPELINDVRKLHGKVEVHLYWGSKHRCLVKCFVPMENLTKVERRNRLIDGISDCQIKAFYQPKEPPKKRNYDPYNYEKSIPPVILGLANWTHSQFTKSQNLKAANGTRAALEILNIFLLTDCRID
jgi:hypothetical protein